MTLRVAYEGGPADGTVEEYPALEAALPRLFWSRDEPHHVAAVYRRATDAPDAASGAWRYVVST